MGAVRDDFADSERNPSVHPCTKENEGDFYEMNVSTLADEHAGDGWVQRTRPYGGKPNPAETAGSAGAGDNKDIKQKQSSQSARTGYNQDQ